MEFQPLHYVYEPVDKTDAPTLLLLHGTGGNEYDLIPLAKEMVSGFNILSVRGNVLEGGMPRFFKRLSMGVFDEDDLKFRTHELVDFLQQLAHAEGFDLTKLVALGYSNGANIVGSLLMLYPEFLAGAILFRPMQPFKEVEMQPSQRKAEVFMGSGQYDNMVSLEEINAYTSLLERNHFDVELHELGTGHQLSHQDLMLAKSWLARWTKKQGYGI